MSNRAQGPSGPWTDGNDFVHESELLRLLGHPVRLKIVAGLAASACCVKDIWGCLDLPQATVSQHLSVLRAHGIIEGTREGTMVTYHVVDPFVRDFVAWLASNRCGARTAGTRGATTPDDLSD